MIGRGWATDPAVNTGWCICELTSVDAADACAGLGFAVLGFDIGVLREENPRGLLKAVGEGTTSLSGRISMIILPARC